MVLAIEAFKPIYSTTMFHLLNNLFLIPQNWFGFEITFCRLKRLTTALDAILVTANNSKNLNLGSFTKKCIGDQ